MLPSTPKDFCNISHQNAVKFHETSYIQALWYVQQQIIGYLILVLISIGNPPYNVVHRIYDKNDQQCSDYI